MLKNFTLATKLLWRELRAGEWLIILLALVLAITAMTALNVYIDRLLHGLDKESSHFLGGDLVITSPTPIPIDWIQTANSYHLQTAEVWSYPTVINSNQQLQLVNLQAVSHTYPLTGKSLARLEPHTIWVEPRLLSLLSIQLDDSVKIGAANFRVAKVLLHDLDSLNTGWSIAPRVLMRLDDVAKTRTALPGSRIDYRLLIVGDKQALTAFRETIKTQLKPGQQIVNVRDQRFALYNILERTENYVQLVLLICLLMSGIAIILSVSAYLKRHYSQVALWRSFGVSKQQIILIFFWQLCIIGLLAGLLGVSLGYLTQSVFVTLFKLFFSFPLPPSSISPMFLGIGFSLLLLFTFAFPIISELPSTPPNYIWRMEKIPQSLSRSAFTIILLIALLSYVEWMMNFSSISLIFLYIIVLIIGFLYIFSWLLLKLLRKIYIHSEGAFRQGLSQIIHHQDSFSLQFICFTLILTSILLLQFIRTGIINHWQQYLPQHTPNYFAINIANDDLPQLRKFFAQQQIKIEAIYPMIRGRLIKLNDQVILSAVPESARNHNALHRELNLSWMTQFPSDNKTVAGSSWSAALTGKPIVSVEKNLATELQLKLGDQLTFQIGDQTIIAKIANFRTLDWTSFHPNFFVIFPPGLLEHFPTTYITSFHLNPQETTIVNQLVNQFPNITVIDVANVLRQLQLLIGNITIAIQYLFLFALASAILIFITSLEASMDERRQTYRLLRVLGANKKYITKSVIVEFLILFGLLSIIALLTAKLGTWLLTNQIFRIK